MCRLGHSGQLRDRHLVHGGFECLVSEAGSGGVAPDVGFGQIQGLARVWVGSDPGWAGLLLDNPLPGAQQGILGVYKQIEVRLGI